MTERMTLYINEILHMPISQDLINFSSVSIVVDIRIVTNTSYNGPGRVVVVV